jgi:hypothetical protein
MTNRTDNFNRADTSSDIGTPSDAGSAWVQANGTWGIGSNQALEAGNSHAIAVLESSISDVDVQATISATHTEGGLIARYSTTASYILLATIPSTGLVLYRRDGAGFNSIGTWSGTLSTNDVIKLRCNGTSISAYQNGVERIAPVTESHNSTETEHGIRISGSPNWRWDDFSITALSTGTEALTGSASTGGQTTPAVGTTVPL